MFQTGIIRSAYQRASHFQHPEDKYMAWVLLAAEEGTFAYEIADRETGEAGAGDVVFCPPGTVLRRRALTPAFVFHFMEFDPREVIPRAGKHTVLDRARLSHTFSELERLSASREEDCRLWMPHLVHDIVYQCGCLQRRSARPAPPADPLMEKARHFLEANYRNADLSLAAVAAFLGLSPVQLTRRFVSAYDLTPSACLTGLRLGHAHERIVNTPLSLAQIAEECGYRDAFYLSRVFKSAYGLSPAHYRRQHRI